MKLIKTSISFLLLIAMLVSVMPMNVLQAEDKAPTLTVDNYIITLTDGDNIDVIRFAKGDYSTSSEIRNAPDCVNLSASLVEKNVADGIFSYVMPDGGYYSLWVRMDDGSVYILHADLTYMVQSLTASNSMLTVNNLYGVKNYFIAKGDYDTYADVKANHLVLVSNNDISGLKQYSYMIKEAGLYTVYIRYNDTARDPLILKTEVEVVTPEYTPYGLQLKLANLKDVKVIRYAYGNYATPGDVKRAAGCITASDKSVIKGSDTYTLQFRKTEPASIAVIYYSGYHEMYYYEPTQMVPTVSKEENVITFGNLDEMAYVRYAEGVYETSKEIKNAPGMVKLRPGDRVDGLIKVTLDVGTYTFCVQYKDESYNYYVITITEDDIPVVEPTATNLHVSCAFSHDMILQRDEQLSVWGTADVGSGNVFVEFGGETAIAKVDSTGNWKAIFDKTFPYTTEGQDLTITGGEESIVFNNVLVGDVYYVMGGTNVYYSMGELILDLKLNNASDQLVVDYDDNRDIRFYRVSSRDYASFTGSVAQGTSTVFTDVYSGAYWMTPSEIATEIVKYANFTPTSASYDRETISDNVFSALGYMFAYNMSTRSEVPVGVIEIDADEMPVTSFAPGELAEKWGCEVLGADGTYHYKLASNEYTNIKSRFVYNQQIHPLSNFSCAGVVWYQGEADQYNVRQLFGSSYNKAYSDQVAQLMKYFRSTFGNSDFPVYMIEFPVCYYNHGANNYIDIGNVRSELGTIPQKLDNCYIASSSDLWFDAAWNNNIYPYIKHLNAYRLTDVVMADKFSDRSIDDVCGPVLKDVEYVSISKAYVTFDHVGAGLQTFDGSGEVKGIEIFINYNGSGLWIPHEGKIITGTNQITIDAGSWELWGVRYGQSAEATHPYVRTLCNAYGMPAISFVDFNVNDYFTMSIDNTGWDIHTPEKTTGYDYRYGPTLISYDDGSMDAWFSCTGNNPAEELDYISYKHSEDGGKTWSKEKIVLSPTGLSKDRLSCCDPGAIYFNGYYYLGYTSTLDSAGYSNHVFVARSKNPDGPYEKWDGSGWGGSPEPLVTYDGHGDEWGIGEVSFVKVDNTLYVYYSLKSSKGQWTLVSTADAANENWPATLKGQQKAITWGYGQAAADVKYDTETGLFIAASIVNSNAADCYMALFTSQDGFTFTESSRSYTNMKAYSMNNGITGGPDGTFDSSKDKLYIAYAYGANWGCWATRLAPVTLELTTAIDLGADKGTPDTTMFTPVMVDRYTIGVTTLPHYYVANVGGSFTVDGYTFDDKMGIYPITDVENMKFSSYDTSIVSFKGNVGTALKTGRTLVTMTYKDEFYVTFTVDVRAAGTDITSATVYEWTPWNSIIYVTNDLPYTPMIKGVAVTHAGLIGEAFNDPLDKAIFTPSAYPVTYSNYDTTVIGVSSMGVITPIRAGKTDVTVTIAGGKSFTVTVNVIM